MAAAKTFTVKLVKSPIGARAEHVASVRGMGLKKIGSTKTLIDTPATRGMVNAVRHLVIAI
jgi:large subunit ribosomal protein L30